MRSLFHLKNCSNRGFSGLVVDWRKQSVCIDIVDSCASFSSRRIPGHIREFNWLEPHLGNEMVFKTWQN